MSMELNEAHRVVSRKIIQCLWHCLTNGGVILTPWRTFKAAWLAEQILMYFSDLVICWISQTQAKIAYVFTAWNTVVCLSMEMLSLLPKDYPKTPAPVAFCFLYSSVFQMGPWTAGGALGPLVHSCLVDIVTLCLGSKLHAGFIVLFHILSVAFDLWSCISPTLCRHLGWR